ncbi:MAG: amidohydrolase family protein, partial [Acidobacteriota bacterium]
FWDGEDPDFAARVASLLVDRRIALIPNLVAYDQIIAEIENLDRLLAEKNWNQVTPLARIYSQVPYNGYVEDFAGADIRDRALAHFRKQHAMMFEIVREVKRRGGILVAGSDAGNPTMYPGDGLHRELELRVAAGLSTDDALIAATRSAAAVLGEENRRGRLAPGFEAELVLLDRDPTVDIRATRTVSALYSKGMFVAREDLEDLGNRLAMSAPFTAGESSSLGRISRISAFAWPSVSTSASSATVITCREIEAAGLQSPAVDPILGSGGSIS